MAGALAEFSRRPPGTRAAIYVGAAMAIGLLYWQFGLSPVRTALKDAEREHEDAVAEEFDLAKKKKERDALIATQEQLKLQIEQNQKALPTDAEMPAFFDMLARKFAEASVQVNRREVKAEVSVENFVKAPVDVEVSGTFYQLKQFFWSLRPREDAQTSSGAAEKDRIVTIENITVSNPRMINNQLLLTAKFTASTFRAIPPPPDPAEVAAAAAAAAAAKAAAAGSGSGSGSAKPTTGPSTSTPPLTPAAAKAAAEAGNAASVDRASDVGDEPKGSGLDRVKGGQ